MKYDFKKPLLTTEGAVVLDQSGKELWMSQVLAIRLNEQSRPETKGDTMKVFDWAMTLYKDGELNLDRSDVEKMEGLIAALEIPRFIRGQMLEVLKEK